MRNSPVLTATPQDEISGLGKESVHVIGQAQCTEKKLRARRRARTGNLMIQPSLEKREVVEVIRATIAPARLLN